MKEKGGYPFSGDHFLSGAENYPLCKAMVDHDQQGIKARGGGEVDDQVAGDLLEGARHVGLDWGEWRDGGVCVCLVWLTYGIAFDILTHKLCETRPPKLSGDKLASLEIARVTSGLVVMAAGEDGMAEGVLRRDIDMAFVSQDVVIKFPI